MRVLYISQYYPPESNAPANRVSAMARRWAERGAEVQVLTGAPNHPEGRLYPGHRNAVIRERDAGVDVLRLPIYLAANSGKLRRSLGYASFGASAALLGRALRKRPDVVIATSPQILVGLAGIAHTLSRRIPFVFEVRDLWPDSIVAVGALPEGHPAIGLLKRVERGLYRRADRVVVVTEAFSRIVQERGVPGARVDVFPNGLDSALFSPVAPTGEDESRWPGKLVVSFVGTVGMAHGIGTLLDAAARLADRPDVHFVIAGSGAELDSLRQRVRDEGLENVEFLGRIPRAEVPRLLRRTDVSLVSLRPSPLFETVLPSKIFEAMGTARPILLAVDGEARRVVEGAGAGLYVQPGDVDSLVAGVKHLADDPELRAKLGAAGLRCAREDYDRTRIADAYLDMLSHLAV